MAFGERIIQLGQVIGNQRTQQAEALRKQRQEERDEERLSFTRTEHEEKQKKSELESAYASQLEKIDPTAALALRAGHAGDIKSLLAIKRDQLNKDKYQKRYEEFSLVTSMKKDAQATLAGMQKEIAKAKFEGQHENALELMEQYNVYQDTIKDMIANKIATLDQQLGWERAEHLKNESEQLFAQYPKERMELATQAMNRKIASESGFASKWTKELDEIKEVAGVTVDLTGIPDSHNIYRMATAMVNSGKYTPQYVAQFIRIENPDDLKEALNSGDLPEEAQHLAGSLYKRLVGMEIIAPGVLGTGKEESSLWDRMTTPRGMNKGKLKRAQRVGAIKNAYKVLAKAKAIQDSGRELSEKQRKEIEDAKQVIKNE